MFRRVQKCPVKLKGLFVSCFDALNGPGARQPSRSNRFKARSDIAVAMLADADPDAVETNLEDWIKKELLSERFREAVKEMRVLMEELPAKN
jgi:hypothetical protein